MSVCVGVRGSARECVGKHGTVVSSPSGCLCCVAAVLCVLKVRRDAIGNFKPAQRRRRGRRRKSFRVIKTFRTFVLDGIETGRGRGMQLALWLCEGIGRKQQEGNPQEISFRCCNTKFASNLPYVSVCVCV